MTIAGSLCGYCVFNVKKAVSRLDFGPKGDDVKIVDIKRGWESLRPSPINKPRSQRSNLR